MIEHENQTNERATMCVLLCEGFDGERITASHCFLDIYQLSMYLGFGLSSKAGSPQAPGPKGSTGPGDHAAYTSTQQQINQFADSQLPSQPRIQTSNK